MTILAFCIGWWIGMHTHTLYAEMRDLLVRQWDRLQTAIRRRLFPYN